MRQLISVWAVAVVAAAGHFARADAPYFCGDVSDDGAVNTTDARLIQRYVVGQIPESALHGGVEICDVNNDGSCNTTDAQIIQNIAIGQIPESFLYCGQEVFITSETYDKDALTSESAVDGACEDAAEEGGVYAGEDALFEAYMYLPSVAGGNPTLEANVYTTEHELISEVTDPDIRTEDGGTPGAPFVQVKTDGTATGSPAVTAVSPALEAILFESPITSAEVASLVCLSVTE